MVEAIRMAPSPLEIGLFALTWAMIIPLYYRIGCLDAKMKMLLRANNIDPDNREKREG